MNEVFCTVVSSLRAYQAIALYLSMANVMKTFLLYVLCVDENVYRLFQTWHFNHVILLQVGDINDDQPEEIKSQRKLNEYCWSLKPLLIQTLFDHDETIQRITYIDADLFFWSDPSRIFTNQPNSSVLLSRGDIIIPMLPLPLIHLLQESMGYYNSGFISFKKDKSALDCLAWWKNRCLESCVAKPSAGKFGDQKYLDDMPELFAGVDDIWTPGVNIGHWNNSNTTFGFVNGILHANNHVLIVYHFSGFRILENGTILTIFETDRPTIPFFYGIYTDILVGIIHAAKTIDPDFKGFSSDDDMVTG